MSVLMPVRDAEATVPAALRSVQRQTLASWECVVVDDGSADATPQIVARIAARDPRIRLVRRPALGIVAALEHGATQCRAPYVARMDGDDLMHRKRLELQVGLLTTRPELSACGTGVRTFPRAVLRGGSKRYEAWLNSLADEQAVRRDCWIECPLAHPTLMMRRELLARIGYRDVPWPEDYDLVLRWLCSGARVGTVPQRLLFWRDGPNRTSRTDERYGLDRFAECKAEHLAASLLAGSDRYVLWGYGGTGKALARCLGARGKYPERIIELHPGRLGQRIAGAPVLPPESLARRPGVPIIASVAGAGPRGEIRAALARLGYVELRDFVCAA